MVNLHFHLIYVPDKVVLLTSSYRPRPINIGRDTRRELTPEQVPVVRRRILQMGEAGRARVAISE